MIQLTDNLTISTIRSGKGDCVHICFIGSSGQPHNIIVDSGPTSSAGEFRNLLTSIIRSGETLDALIITHYDDDHIGGILKACDPGFTEIYFNTYAEATETENLSATQNQRLFHSLDRSKIHSSVLAGDEIAIDGARIIVHAPKPEMLSRAMAKMEEANAQLASVSDWTCSLDDLMAKPYPSSDTSIANQSSIVFTFEYKAIVVDLWTLYFFVKVQAQEVMSHFKTIYITYDTVSMALQEINQVNDDDIRRVLIHLQREGNVKLLSPTLEQQLTVRNPSYNFMEVHSACLLAQELNCPAFVGEFRFEIPEQLRSKVIRPDNLKEVMDCVMDKKLLEAE